MGLLVALVPAQDRPVPRRGVLRVREGVGGPAVRAELGEAPLAHGLGEPGLLEVVKNCHGVEAAHSSPMNTMAVVGARR